MNNRQITLNIYFQLINKTYAIKESSDVTVKEIVEAIEDQKFSEEQTIELYQKKSDLEKERKLKNEEKLGDLTQEDQCNLQGKIFQGKQINIQICNKEQNKKYDLSINTNCKIKKLVKKLQEQYQLPQITLKFAQTVLDPEKKCSYYQIPENTQLELIIVHDAGGIVSTLNS